MWFQIHKILILHISIKFWKDLCGINGQHQHTLSRNKWPKTKTSKSSVNCTHVMYKAESNFNTYSREHIVNFTNGMGMLLLYECIRKAHLWNFVNM
jgi:hypothetical protein